MSDIKLENVACGLKCNINKNTPNWKISPKLAWNFKSEMIYCLQILEQCEVFLLNRTSINYELKAAKFSKLAGIWLKQYNCKTI